uniref:Uncharacterized protein n=1 Tax=Arundo donax TaxID=35708 RepID=A0A0A9BJ63_ARUDO
MVIPVDSTCPSRPPEPSPADSATPIAFLSCSTSVWPSPS